MTLAAVYYLLAALALTLWLWRDPASRTVAGNPNDADQMAWFFRYDATAIAHFHLPALVTTAMNAPQGVNLMWNTPLLLPGVLLAPVTLAFGPQVSLTLLLTIGFAGSATAMFAVLRRWQVSVPGAALGAAVYGFSPALVHSAIGHYDLQFAVFPPLIVDAVLRLATGRSGVRRGGLWLGLLVTAQLFISEEILFGAGLAAALLLVVMAASRPRDVPGRVRTLAGGLGIAAGVLAVLAGYPLWVQFFGPLYQHGSPFTTDFFKNDLSGFVVPSSYMFFHTAGSAAEALRYQGQLPEYLGYLGWPLIAVLAAGTIWFWRRLPVRACAVACVVLEVFSLGGTLLASGHEHQWIKLPWYWLQSLPVLSAALPDRFSIVADGAAAALLACCADAAVPALAAFAGRRLPGLASGGTAGRGGPGLRRPGRPAHRAPAAARRGRDLGAARLVGGVRRAGPARLGHRARGAGPDVDLHRTAALAGRHGPAAHPGRRVLHGPGQERPRLHRRQRPVTGGPVPEHLVDRVRGRAARGADRGGAGQRAPRVAQLRADRDGQQRQDAGPDRRLARLGGGRGRGPELGPGRLSDQPARAARRGHRRRHGLAPLNP